MNTGATAISYTGSRSSLVIVILLSVLAAVAALALTIGPIFISPAEAWLALLGIGSEVHKAIMLEIRLPRLLLAVGVGGVLGMAGAVLQGYLRNPLADASVLGTSNAAALGAVIALYFGMADGRPYVLPVMAIGMALLALACIFGLIRQHHSAAALILAGLAVGTLAGAGVSLALNLSANPFAVAEIAFWLLGSLEDRSMVHVALAMPLLLAACLIFLFLGRTLDALSLGEDAAQGMGVHLGRAQMLVIVGVALGVGAAVAVSGAIGFVGLVVPHLLRPFVGHRPSRLLLPSAIAGALLLVAADSFVRVIPTTGELRLGVVTAFLGIPFFLYLLLRRYRIF